MKYLKIAALFSLINAIFFGVFLYVIYSQNLSLKPQESNTQAVEQTAGGVDQTATTSPAPAASLPKVQPQGAAKEPSQTKASSQSPAPSPAVTPKPSAPTPTQTQPAQSNRCIITISGQHYDVTDFRSQHSGGDIFVCGTDMTRTFFGQHDQALLDSPQMSRMRVQ